MFVYLTTMILLGLLGFIIYLSKFQKDNGQINQCPDSPNLYEDNLLASHIPHFKKIENIFNNLPDLKESKENIDYIIIDDDSFNDYAIWDPASKNLNFKYHFYTCPFELAQNIHKYPKTTPIIFDSYLKNNVHGEIISRSFYERGHHNLYIATGRALEEFSGMHYYWIKDILPKESITGQKDFL